MSEDPTNPETDAWSVEQAFELHRLIANRTNRPAPPSADDDRDVKDED